MIMSEVDAWEIQGWMNSRMLFKLFLGSHSQQVTNIFNFVAMQINIQFDSNLKDTTQFESCLGKKLSVEGPSVIFHILVTVTVEFILEDTQHEDANPK